MTAINAKLAPALIQPSTTGMIGITRERAAYLLRAARSRRFGNVFRYGQGFKAYLILDCDTHILTSF